MLTIGYSFVMSMLFLPSSLLLFGAANQQGDLEFLVFKYMCGVPHDRLLGLQVCVVLCFVGVGCFPGFRFTHNCHGFVTFVRTTNVSHRSNAANLSSPKTVY